MTYNSRNTIIYFVYLWAGGPCPLFLYGLLPVDCRSKYDRFFLKQKLLLRMAELCLIISLSPVTAAR